MSGSYYTLNSKYNSLLALIAGGGGGGGVANPMTSNLDAGGFDITNAGTMSATDLLGEQLVINEPVGGDANPALVINQTNAAGDVLVEEMYNQRTGVNGEFNRQSFFAKNNTGTKTEFARVSGTSVNYSSQRGGLELSVSDSMGMSAYIGLNGQNGIVEVSRDLNMVSNDITNAATISTPNANTYAPQQVQVLTANGDFVAGTDDKMRQVLVNAGVLPTFQDAVGAGVNPLPSNEDPTAAIVWNGYWWVGTAQGGIYYSSDYGYTWNSFINTGGQVNCFGDFGGSYLFVGGSFSSPYYNGFYIDTGFNYYDMTNGDGGFNGQVYCFAFNSIYSIMYVGGDFTGTYNGTYPSNYWWNFDGSSGYSWDGGNTSGFQNGAVRTILRDPNSGWFVIGGEFNDFDYSGSQGIPYLITIDFIGYNINSFQSFGFSCNAPVYATQPYADGNGSGFLVGGALTACNGWSNCFTDFGFHGVWNGGSWDGYNYPYTAHSYEIRSIWYENSIYYTLESGSSVYLWQDGTQLPALPSGTTWNNVSYNGNGVVFATNNQSGAGFPYYYLVSGTTVFVSLATNAQEVVKGGNTFSNDISLAQEGDTCELIYNAANNKWYVLSTQGTVAFT